MSKKKRGSRAPAAVNNVGRKLTPKNAASAEGTGKRAASVSSADLWRAIQESQLSFEPEAQAMLLDLMELGETRFTEIASQEAMKTGARGEVTVVPSEIIQKLHGRAEQSARLLVRAVVKVAGTSSTVSVAALHVAQERTFCTVWPWCAKY
jgi:hypothetical protein